MTYLLPEKEKDFKVGWVYEDGYGESHLIIKIDEEYDHPLRTVNLRNEEHNIYFKNGVARQGNFPISSDPSPKHNLILSTGRKWALLEEPQEFKVGWVYEDGRGDKWLVYKIIENIPQLYPIQACSWILQEATSFEKDGTFHVDKPDSKRNLILFTGKKWGPLEETVEEMYKKGKEKAMNLLKEGIEELKSKSESSSEVSFLNYLTKMIKPEIEPCFYCGNECIVDRRTGLPYFMRCKKPTCYKSPEIYLTEEEAIKAHNEIARKLRVKEKKY